MSRQRESYPLGSNSAEKLKSRCYIWCGMLQTCQRSAGCTKKRFADGGRGTRAVVDNTNQRSLAQGMLECHRRC